uniref:Regulator of microtubule dynamics protein 1 n=1 Tax=Amblyomma cajennense TaxID=34607 RepID=A0A023FET0_AMBCJ
MSYRARLWSLRYGFAPFAISLRVRSAGLSSKFQGWRRLTTAGQGTVSAVVPQVFLLCGLALLDMSEVEHAKQEADRLHEAGDHEASYNMLLLHKDCGDPDLLWRLARVTFKRCELAPKAEKEAGLAEGIAYLDKAVQCGGENLGPVHKWYSILIGSKKDHPTTKERIHDGFLIKKHVQRAIELMPQDPLNYYVLGNWCYEVAGTPWLIRKAGQLIFSEIPSSTYEEALKHFLKAEEIKPNFYTRNLLMIAKTLLELNRKDEAVTYLKRCVNLNANPTVDDKRVCEEAQQSLKKLGMS